MSNINQVAVSGNLTRDPELRHTGNGTAVVNLGLAVNRSVKKDDEWVEEPHFFEVTVWGGRAEQAALKLRKGSFVFGSGRLEQQKWETPEGEKRSKVGIVAERLEGPDFFKKADEVAAAAADDDIPF